MSKSAVTIGLDFLSRELRKAKLCGNTKPIDDAINDLKNRKDSVGYWGYNMQKLVFDKIETPRGSMPNNIKSIKIVLSVEIHEKSLKNDEIYNPIIVDPKKGVEKNYNFSIEISGYSGQNKVISHWHLDFDSNKNNEYIHPDFHLTFGGNAMKTDGGDENQVFGKVLILPSPRLPYPPMDAILGIDFIIKNFIQETVVRNLINNSQYKKAVKSSQERLWRPYMLALANHWCAFKNCPHFDTDNSLSNKYYPTLIT
jgi:hypothetical protein